MTITPKLKLYNYNIKSTISMSKVVINNKQIHLWPKTRVGHVCEFRALVHVS